MKTSTALPLSLLLLFSLIFDSAIAAPIHRIPLLDAPSPVQSTPEYPKDKICAAPNGGNLPYGKTLLGGIPASNLNACAKRCLEADKCAVFEYSETEFNVQGWNCQIYGRWSSEAYGSQATAQAIIAMEGMAGRDSKRLLFERECAMALL